MYPLLLETRFFDLQSETLLTMIAMSIGVWFAFRRAAPKGYAYQNMILDLSIWLVVAGIVGARLWDVLFTWEFYADNPLEAFQIWHGGMSIQGSLLGGLAATLVFAWRRQVRIWDLLDIMAPPVILGQAIGRAGCLLSGDAFGRPIAEFSWLPNWLGVIYAEGTPAWNAFDGMPLVPAEGFELVLNLVVLALLLGIKPKHEFAGRTALLYGIGYSVVRFGLEFLRGDSLLYGPFKAAQALSVLVVFVCSVVLVVRYRDSRPTPGRNQVAG
jgi:phosphatidylglycerol---prolipoprotein diacylglyceryl transferase